MTEFEQQQKDAEEIRRNITKAAEIIQDGINRYKKEKLKLRRKKDAENLATQFTALDDYASKGEIHDAYGWEYITESEMNRLLELWDAREKAKSNGGKYTDAVLDMLQRAILGLSEPYIDQLDAAEAAAREAEEWEWQHKQEQQKARHEAYIKEALRND